VAGGAYRLLSPPPSGFHPVYGYVSPGDTPDNPQSTYGNPRDLGTDDFGTLVFAGSSDPISVLGFYFFPVVTITGRVDLAEVEWPTQVRVQALDPATSTLYDRYPWTLYGEPWWLRADGRYPESLHLPAGIPLLLGFDGNGYGGPAVPLQDTEAGLILPSGLPPPTAYDSNTNNIPDAWEYFHFQRLVRAEDDEDGDGQSNREEYVGHTDPQDGTDRLLLPGVLQEDGFPVLRWFPRTQRIYTVEQRSLTDTQTVDVAQFEVGFPAPESLVWPVPLTETGGVYRLRVDLPAAP